jgi:hypothetical protein
MKQLGWSNELFAKASPIHGVGLYSGRDFLKGDEIYTINGKHVTASYDSNFSEGPNWIGLGWREWLIPAVTNPIGFTNHSCCPNAIICDQLLVVALCPINSGTEIVVDYSTTEVDPFWQMQCSCGSATCRKHIRAFSYLSTAKQDCYRRFLPRKFIQASRRVDEVYLAESDRKASP